MDKILEIILYIEAAIALGFLALLIAFMTVGLIVVLFASIIERITFIYSKIRDNLERKYWKIHAKG